MRRSSCFGVVCLASLAIAVAGCRPADRSPERSVRVLRIGTSGDYAPFSLAGDGFDIEVARRFASDAGYEIEWTSFRWSELSSAVRENRFDVAMSGVTWRADRAVHGYMTRAVADGGPCLLGEEDAARIAVNRGGILERFARRQLGDREIRAVDDNRDLPRLLADGAVDAVLTDSFELASFRAALADLGRSQAPARCWPPRDRKVYWVSPARADELGPELDRWLAEHEAQLQQLRLKWFGERSERTSLHHVVDLIARRMAFMPAVAAWKQARGLPIEDLEREERVLRSVGEGARTLRLPAAEVEQLFAIQIELAKQVQARAREAESLNLEAQVRPALLALGNRILEALRELEPRRSGPDEERAWAYLDELLLVDEAETLRNAIQRVRSTLSKGRTNAGAEPQKFDFNFKLSLSFLDLARTMSHSGVVASMPVGR